MFTLFNQALINIMLTLLTEGWLPSSLTACTATSPVVFVTRCISSGTLTTLLNTISGLVVATSNALCNTQQGDNSMEIFWLFKMVAALPIQHF
jgi:hypothetical protein